MVPRYPQVQMLQYFPDHRFFFNKGNNFHVSLAFWTNKWIRVVDLLYQASPVSTEGFSGNIILYQGRDGSTYSPTFGILNFCIYSLFFFTDTPHLVAVISIIAYKLFPFVWDMCHQSCQPVKSGKALPILAVFSYIY